MRVVFSDVDGLYTVNPRLNPTARRLPVVEKVTAEIEALAGVSDSGVGMTSRGRVCGGPSGYEQLSRVSV